jgi:hypothetical protein
MLFFFFSFFFMACHATVYTYVDIFFDPSLQTILCCVFLCRTQRDMCQQLNLPSALISAFAAAGGLGRRKFGGFPPDWKELVKKHCGLGSGSASKGKGKEYAPVDSKARSEGDSERGRRGHKDKDVDGMDEERQDGEGGEDGVDGVEVEEDETEGNGSRGSQSPAAKSSRVRFKAQSISKSKSKSLSSKASAKSAASSRSSSSSSSSKISASEMAKELASTAPSRKYRATPAPAKRGVGPNKRSTGADTSAAAASYTPLASAPHPPRLRSVERARAGLPMSRSGRKVKPVQEFWKNKVCFALAINWKRRMVVVVVMY